MDRSTNAPNEGRDPIVKISPLVVAGVDGIDRINHVATA